MITKCQACGRDKGEVNGSEARGADSKDFMCYGGLNHKFVDIIDNSRLGGLIHSATSNGRWVKLVVYIEGGNESGKPIGSDIVCRTSEQAAKIAEVLRNAKFEND